MIPASHARGSTRDESDAPFGILLARKGVNLNKDSMMKREKGFTLLELMVTIVILCVLLGLAIPGFSRWVPNYRLRGAARDIYSNLQLAKMTAVKDRKRCRVSFDVANSRYQLISVSSGPNGTFGDGDDVTLTLKTVNFSEYGSGVGYGHGSATAGVGGAGFDNGVTLDEDGIVFDSRGMVFRPSGPAASADGYVYLQNNKNGAYAVGVLTSGVILIRRWTGSAWQQ
jgi:prepilin-type N-terminal cleavage/methylation domain-containing protein